MRVWVRAWAVALSAALFAQTLRAQDQAELRLSRSGLVFIPRVDVLFVATVEEQLHCSATGTAFCRPEDSAQFDYDDTSRVALGVDALGNLSRNLRLGGGLWYVPEARVRNENDFEVEWA